MGVGVVGHPPSPLCPSRRGRGPATTGVARRGDWVSVGGRGEVRVSYEGYTGDGRRLTRGPFRATGGASVARDSGPETPSVGPVSLPSSPLRTTGHGPPGDIFGVHLTKTPVVEEDAPTVSSLAVFGPRYRPRSPVSFSFPYFVSSPTLFVSVILHTVGCRSGCPQRYIFTEFRGRQ